MPKAVKPDRFERELAKRGIKRVDKTVMFAYKSYTFNEAMIELFREAAEAALAGGIFRAGDRVRHTRRGWKGYVKKNHEQGQTHVDCEFTNEHNDRFEYSAVPDYLEKL